jgi:hypothetical protein
MRFVMAEVGIQADLENADRRSSGWVAGAAVIAIVFVTVLGIDRERMLFTSDDNATSPSPMMNAGKGN